jgi:hypothetical protein
MKNGGAADKDAISDLHVSGHEDVVGQNDVIPEPDIVREMRPGHEKAAVANHGFAVFVRAPMNRGVFANTIIVADDYAASHLGLERKILRIPTDQRAMSDRVILSHHDLPPDDRMRVEHAPFADHRRPFDDHVGADRDVVRESGIGMNNGGRMNRAHVLPFCRARVGMTIAGLISSTARCALRAWRLPRNSDHSRLAKAEVGLPSRHGRADDEMIEKRKAEQFCSLGDPQCQPPVGLAG